MDGCFSREKILGPGWGKNRQMLAGMSVEEKRFWNRRELDKIEIQEAVGKISCYCFFCEAL